MTEAAEAKQKGFSGSTLKIIAVISMFIDHVAATVMRRCVIANGGSLHLSFDNGLPDRVVLIYYALRLIGRLAFPIYVFLLVEGFQYTHSRLRYLVRLLVFAIVSEIPFDMALNISRSELLQGRFLEFEYQNVFFTLAIGMLVMIGMDKLYTTNLPYMAKRLLQILVVFAGAGLAELLRTDYGMVGIFTIAVMYFLRELKPAIGAFGMSLVLTISTPLELTTFLIMLPIAKYNGTRGLRIKYLFYSFYPAHFLLLAITAVVLGY